MSDVAAGTLADANPLAGQHIVDVHKGIMGCHSQVLPRVCNTQDECSPNSRRPTRFKEPTEARQIPSGTLGETDVRDEFFPVMEGDHVLQCVGVHHQETAVVQTHCQSFTVRGEGAATPACQVTHTQVTLAQTAGV